MQYLSICSGIEAASMAWRDLRWEPIAFSEVDKFPSAVLRHHYPTVPNWGDMTNFLEWPDAAVDLLVGGTPCQSFSIAGLRKGLADPRGNLMLTYLAIARRYRPLWLVWENVPGVLSSNGGRDFGTLLGSLGELGYGFAYRVLDAKYCGVPQKRRRVFVVGYLGDWRRAAAVLFERHSLSGYPPPGREARENITGTLSARTQGGGGLGTDFDLAGGLQISMCMNAHGGSGRLDAESETFVPQTHVMHTPSVVAIQEAASRENPASGPQGKGWRDDGLAYTLDAATVPQAVITRGVRRLTPRECERLQGFPDVTKSVTVSIWPSIDQAENAARAGTLNPRSHRSASNAEGNGLARSARYADEHSSIDHQSPVPRVVVTVRIDSERQQVAVLRTGRLIWSASTAEKPGASPLLMPVADFVQLVASMLIRLDPTIHAGGEGSRASINAFSDHLNGSASVNLSGDEIAANAGDAEKFTTGVAACMKFTTSGAGRIFQISEPIWKIWCSCVTRAIGSCIPDEIRAASSFDVSIELSHGYTAIPYRRKPAADGPRYKAIGNSMAVPVMRWIGERISLVNSISAVGA